jgi:hypothetical protein
MTSPISLSDAQMRELQAAAATIPVELRDGYLERVAAKLQGQDIGDGTVHRVAYEVAREMIWDAGRRAIG